MMHRSSRVAMAAGSLFGRAALGFAAFMGILAIVSPPPEPGALARRTRLILRRTRASSR